MRLTIRLPVSRPLASAFASAFLSRPSRKVADLTGHRARETPNCLPVVFGQLVLALPMRLAPLSPYGASNSQQRQPPRRQKFVLFAQRPEHPVP